MSLTEMMNLIYQIGGNSMTGKTTSTCDPYAFEWTAPSERGWECPRCGQIWAPWISQCNCSRNKTYVTWTTGVSSSKDIHDKQCTGTYYKTD